MSSEHSTNPDLARASGNARQGPALASFTRRLRAFVGDRPGKSAPAAEERCELCATPLGPGHEHLVDPKSHALRCTCRACALLFSARDDGKWKRVEHRVAPLRSVKFSDAEWDGLSIPIGLAFFVKSSAAGRTLAFYPSPAGATESQLALEDWEGLVTAHPSLAALEADVEALLVNRVGDARACYRVSIDECYRLVGLVRRHWKGFGGGQEAWAEIDAFFASLENDGGARA